MTIPLPNRGGFESDLDPGGALAKLFADHYDGAEPWRKIDSDWLGPAPKLAMAIQSYTNNTSLVLALEIGPVGHGDVFLVAADAQIGNWESWQSWKWLQDKPDLTGPDLLARTIFYKVGRHGSHNAILKDHGLEQMANLKVAVCQVDETEAQEKSWKTPPDALGIVHQINVESVVFLRTRGGSTSTGSAPL